jgi:hypothetical protein
VNHTKHGLYAAPLDGEWIKSSYSDANTDNCVCLMKIHGGIAVGDSKRPNLAPLRYSLYEIGAFIRAVKCGEFDDALDG